jgi:hypothetical protein
VVVADQLEHLEVQEQEEVLEEAVQAVVADQVDQPE